MTAILQINDQYAQRFQEFIEQLPKGVAKVTPIKANLDDEIKRRVAEIQNGTMKTTPFHQGLDALREKIVAKI